MYHSLCFTLSLFLSASSCFFTLSHSFCAFFSVCFCLRLFHTIFLYILLYLSLSLCLSQSHSLCLTLSLFISFCFTLSLIAFHSLYFSQSQTVLLYVSLSQPFSVSFSFIVFHCVFFPIPLSLLSNKYTITFPCSPTHAKNVLLVQLCNGDSEETVLAVRIKFHFVNKLTPVWIIVWIPGVGIEVLL